MPPKAKVRVAGKAKPPAKTAGKNGSSAMSQEGRAEVDTLIGEVFAVCDGDQGGSIQFQEFLNQHRMVIELAAGYFDDGACPRGMLDEDEAEETFRKLDTDHNMQLDQAEFAKYMESVLSVIGIRNFTELCKLMLERRELLQRRGRKVRAGFDLAKSSLLLDAISSAGNLILGTAGFIAAMKLLDAKADPNYEDHDGCNSVILAANKGDPVMLAKLIEGNADPRVCSPSGDNAVFRAAVAHNFAALNFLLTDGRNMAEDKPGTTVSTTKRNSLEASAPTVQRSGTSLLAETKRPTLMAASLTCADLAAGRRPSKSEVADAVEDVDHISESLVVRMTDLSSAGIAELLKKKANVNHKSQSGWTPLTMAAFCGKKELVETLLRSLSQFKNPRAWLNLRNLRGRGALHVAARKAEATAIIPLLVKSGADQDLQDSDGWTPLHHAAFNGNDLNVLELVKGGASITVRGRNGFTPFMASFLPTRAGELGKEAAKALKPPETVQFKFVAEQLSKEDLEPYDRLAALKSLPGVCQNIDNLRLYEQYFPSMAGPNKVRLQKVWDRLAAPMIRRLRTLHVDMEEPGPHMAPAAVEEARDEIRSRLRDQKSFVQRWFDDTRGPRRIKDSWDFDNRGCIEEEMRKVIDEEWALFGKELEKLYEELLPMDGGAELAALPAVQVLEERYLTQLGAHPIPVWLEEMDAIGAFQAMWDVGTPEIKREEDEDDAAMGFLELLTNNLELSPGPAFWRNSYKYWFHHYCERIQGEFHSKIWKTLQKFNDAHPDLQQDDDGNALPVEYRRGPLKTCDQIKRKERLIDTPCHQSFAGRTIAANILDVLRGSVVVRNPAAAVALVKHFKSCTCNKDKLQLVQLKSQFAKNSETEDGGYRKLELNILYDGGPHKTHDRTIDLMVVGEIQINLAGYIAVKKRRHLLRKYKKGDYNYPPEDAELGDGLADD